MDVAGCTTSSSGTSTADHFRTTSAGDGIARNRTNYTKNTNRRRRTTFSPSQLRVLEDVFSRQQYLVGNERLRLASILNIGVTQVWFQNRRIRWRREQREMLVATRYETTTTSTSSTVPSSTLTPGVTLPEDLIMPTSALSEMRSAGDN